MPTIPSKQTPPPAIGLGFVYGLACWVLTVLLIAAAPDVHAEESAGPEEGALIGVGVGNPFLVCMTLLPDRDICTERLGRNAWRPEKPRDPKGRETCEYYAFVIEDRIKFGDLSPWEDLYYNERCRTLGLPYFDGLANATFVQREYIDPEGRFSVQYPPDWEILPYTSFDREILIGSGEVPLGSCGVGIEEADDSREKTPAEMVRETWRSGQYEAEMREYFSDLNILWKGEIKLSGSRAFEIIWDSLWPATGTLYGERMIRTGQRIKTYHVMTWRDGQKYNVSCGSDKRDFDGFQAKFKLFVASFLIRK